MLKIALSICGRKFDSRMYMQSLETYVCKSFNPIYANFTDSARSYLQTTSSYHIRIFYSASLPFFFFPLSFFLIFLLLDAHSKLKGNRLGNIYNFPTAIQLSDAIYKTKKMFSFASLCKLPVFFFKHPIYSSSLPMHIFTLDTSRCVF